MHCDAMFLYEDDFGKSRITDAGTGSSTVIDVPISALLVGAPEGLAKRCVLRTASWSWAS